jgi:hypothetical protein
VTSASPALKAVQTITISNNPRCSTGPNNTAPSTKPPLQQKGRFLRHLNLLPAPFLLPERFRQLALAAKIGCDRKSLQDQSIATFQPVVNENWGEPDVKPN